MVTGTVIIKPFSYRRVKLDTSMYGWVTVSHNLLQGQKFQTRQSREESFIQGERERERQSEREIAFISHTTSRSWKPEPM